MKLRVGWRCLLASPCLVLARKTSFAQHQALMAQDQDQVPYEMSLTGLESSIMSMALDGASPELQPFLDQISTLTNEMQLKVEEQANASQASLDEAWNNFKACNLDAPNLTNDLQGWNQSHRSCRQEESHLFAEWQECLAGCAPYDAIANSSCEMFKAVDVFPPKGDCKWQDTHESMTVLEYMDILLRDFQQKSKTWNERNDVCRTHTQEAATCYASCSVQESAYREKRAACDLVQASLEQHACGDGTSACGVYRSCYDSKKIVWQETNTTVASEEEAFTAEYRGILRIECLTKAFDTSISQEAADLGTEMEKCRATDFGADAYVGKISISYYDISENPRLSCSGGGPAFIACPPGNEVWHVWFYSDLPPNTTFNPVCNASCCSDYARIRTTTTTTVADRSCLTPVAAGCWTLGDEASCSWSIDGRDDAYYGDSPCVWCGDSGCPSGARCENVAYFEGNNGLQGSYHVADCSGVAPDDPAQECLTPVESGCYTIADRETCLTSMDGRPGYFSKSECVWCENGCPSGAHCEPLKVFEANHNLQSSYTVASCNNATTEIPSEVQCLKPIEEGCYTTNNETTCRTSRDGRSGFYGASPCTWCPRGCPSGAVCEPYKLFTVNDNFATDNRIADCYYDDYLPDTSCLASAVDGCYNIPDYETCVSSIDGRGGSWGNSPCVWCGEEGCPTTARCEPLRYFTFHDNYQDTYVTARCPIEVTTSTTTTTTHCLEKAANGCYTLGEEVACTNAYDGRNDGYWGGYPCVWCPGGCPSGAACESYKWFEANGNYHDSYITAACPV
eukprot:gb/GFBE01054439.1/.p1 GENE.gb/GFBE01054439.1/~~gb/GFBE01054439.1/.p1  ORF type:complete len:794 (+),score=105.30 gb/GFBE01054439.1/:1-2382(+)